MTPAKCTRQHKWGKEGFQVSRLRLGRVKAKELQNEVEPRFFRLRESRCFPEGVLFWRVIVIFRWVEDVKAVRDRDPAARSFLEVFLLYPGVKALRMYRQANFLHRHGFKFWARAVSQRARTLTGIEIHPGATIGRRLVIDHGAGVVIGETAEIGDDVLIYQGVTLGGTGKDTGKRHPTIGNNVMISCGAKVLGPFKVGDNARIAAGAVVLEEVPADSTVVGVPARVVKRGGMKVVPLDQIHIPDPVAQELCRLEQRIVKMEKAKEKNKNENI